jgi:hypothetical protein
MFNKTPECYLLFFIGCKGKTINEKRSFSDRIFGRIPVAKNAERLFGNKINQLPLLLALPLRLFDESCRPYP